MSTNRSWFRSGRFFDYSNTASKDPQFEEYKDKLEKTVFWYDTANSALSYTPPVTLFASTLVGALVQAGLGPVGATLTIINLAIPLTSGLILTASKMTKNDREASAKELIKIGRTNKFFDNTPIITNVTSDDPEEQKNIDNAKQELHQDALNHRLLGPS